MLLLLGLVGALCLTVVSCDSKPKEQTVHAVKISIVYKNDKNDTVRYFAVLDSDKIMEFNKVSNVLSVNIYKDSLRQVIMGKSLLDSIKSYEILEYYKHKSNITKIQID